MIDSTPSSHNPTLQTPETLADRILPPPPKFLTSGIQSEKMRAARQENQISPETNLKTKITVLKRSHSLGGAGLQNKEPDRGGRESFQLSVRNRRKASGPKDHHLMPRAEPGPGSSPHTWSHGLELQLWTCFSVISHFGAVILSLCFSLATVVDHRRPHGSFVSRGNTTHRLKPRSKTGCEAAFT